VAPEQDRTLIEGCRNSTCLCGFRFTNLFRLLTQMNGLGRMIRQAWHSENHASWYILIIKPTRCTNFSNLFLNRTLHVSDRFSVHHQESSTVYTAIGTCHTGYADCLLAGSGWTHPDPASKHSAQPVLHKPIAVYTAIDSWWWTKILSETCRVLFQNKFEKLVHLVGFIIRIDQTSISIYCTEQYITEAVLT